MWKAGCRMIPSIFKLYFKRTKNRVILLIIVVYAVLFSVSIWYSSSAYFESEGNLHMSRSRVANTQAMTLIKTRDVAANGLTDEAIDQKIEFFSTLSKNELTVGKFLLSGEKKNDRFINLTMNNIYTLYLTAFKADAIPLQAIQNSGYTIEELQALEKYTLFLDGYKGDLILNPNEVNSANLSMKFFSGVNLIILTCLIIFLVYDMYLMHIYDGSYKILYTLERSRRKVFASQVVVGVIVGIATFVVSFVIVNLVGFLLGGWGDWNYPLMSKNILPLYQVVIASFVLYLFILISMMAVVLLTSMITDSVSTTLGVFLCLIFISILLNVTQSERSFVRRYFSYSFLFNENVWSFKEQFNLWYGYLSSIVICAISLIIMQLKITGKDMLGETEC